MQSVRCSLYPSFILGIVFGRLCGEYYQYKAAAPCFLLSAPNLYGRLCTPPHVHVPLLMDSVLQHLSVSQLLLFLLLPTLCLIQRRKASSLVDNELLLFVLSFPLLVRLFQNKLQTMAMISYGRKLVSVHLKILFSVFQASDFVGPIFLTTSEIWDWNDGSEVKRVYYSSRGCRFSSQHACRVAHNQLKHSSKSIPCFWPPQASAIKCTYPHHTYYLKD